MQPPQSRRSAFIALHPITRRPRTIAATCTSKPSISACFSSTFIPSTIIPLPHRTRPPRYSTPRKTITSTAKVPLSTRIFDKMYYLSNFITNLFPIWTIIASALALWQPQLFAARITGRMMKLSLSALLLSMGLTFTWYDLRYAFTKPLALLLAFVGCFGVMPILAVVLSRIFALDAAMTGGMVLLGMVSMAQASSLCTYIAGGDTALSVSMTGLTTLSTVFMLPFLSKLLLGAVLPIDAAAIAMSTAQIVFAPILAGVLINRIAPQTVRRIKPLLPVVGIAMVVTLILGPVAQTEQLIRTSFSQLWLPVTLLHALGGMWGYMTPQLLGRSEVLARTTAFATGFKSPALSYILAVAHFPNVGIRLASAVSVIILAPLASACAVLFRALPMRRAGRGREGGGVREGRGAGVGEGVTVAARGVDGNGRAGRKFRVRFADGRCKVVAYERLGVELSRANRGKRKVLGVDAMDGYKARRW